ncbi:hypothetical protein [Bdellovibrio sp. BCCA]|uniref:hypothetical protein n=1 Tax=Bdellovibrio sp. BCCA TaxID=3136281 RepID=UPI0030F07402
MKHIMSFDSMKELESFQRSEKLHQEEYDRSFDLAWNIIENKTKGDKMAKLAMRIVSSHIAAFLYYYDRVPGDRFVKAFQDMLGQAGRTDELEVFCDKFLDNQSRYAEAIYQLYLESVERRRESDTLPEIRKLFKKLSLCPILEIIALIETIELEDPA